MTTVALVLGCLGSLAGIAAFARQIRLERYVKRGVRCTLCGVSDRDPGARERCPRNPNGMGHVYAKFLGGVE